MAEIHVAPAAAAGSDLIRRRLHERLEECLSHRLCTVIAGAGFGKSSLLRTWTPAAEVSWCVLKPEDAHLSSLVRGIVGALPARISETLASTLQTSGPEASEDQARGLAFAQLVTDSLHGVLGDPLVLVIDDAHEVGHEGGAVKFLEELCRLAPSQLHLVLSSRTDVPFPIARLRGRGEVVEINARDLTFERSEIEQVLSLRLGEDSVHLAPQLEAVADGWPVAVRLATEALRIAPRAEWGATLRGLETSGGSLFGYLASEVFDRELPEVRELLRKTAYVDRFTPKMCASLGFTDADVILERLHKQGVFLAPYSPGQEWSGVSNLMRRFIYERHALAEGERSRFLRSAAAWFEESGFLDDALRLARLGQDHDAIARILSEAGSALLSSGSVESVSGAVDALPVDRRDPAIETLAGEARQILGDWEGALACFERAGAAEGSLSPGLAVRTGLIHYFRGDLKEASQVYARGVIDGSDPVNEALLLSGRSSVCWLTGDAEGARRNATEAFKAATDADVPAGLAAAHTSLAMVAALDGDRRANDWHYARALAAAEEANDTLQIIRIRTNRSSYFTEQGSYNEALEELEVAVPLAEVAGFAAFHGLGLLNRGWAYFQLGRLEDAISDLEKAKEIFQRMGSSDVGHALALLGTVYMERGESALALACFEEAITVGERSDDIQALLPALTGMARLLLSDAPDEAQAFAARALALARGIDLVQARLVSGWVAVERGLREEALHAADQAEKEARFRRDRPGIAESLELRAAASPATDEAIEHLEQASAIWQRIGNPLAEARTDLRKAALLKTTSGQTIATAALERLRGMGARRLAALAETLQGEIRSAAGSDVAIETLGGFRIMRGGNLVGLGEWQSKKARDLLKLLVSKRGRPVSRETLMEELWPGEDPAKLRNRMGVAQATIRAVLDKDRRFPPDHFIASEGACIFLRLEHVDVDAEALLAAAAEGFGSLRRGDFEKSFIKLAEAESLYRGDFLEGDPYEDWAVALREEARATYIAVSHTLAANAIEEKDLDTAIRLYLRILERDAYDETAHLGLVTALARLGRHGEARRAHRAYVEKMDEIEVEAAPFPTTFLADEMDKSH